MSLLKKIGLPFLAAVLLAANLAPVRAAVPQLTELSIIRAGVSTPASGTVTVANTFYATALVLNPTRQGGKIVNTSATAAILLYFGTGTPTAAASIPLAAGASYNLVDSSGKVIQTDAVQITSTTAGATWVTLEIN